MKNICMFKVNKTKMIFQTEDCIELVKMIEKTGVSAIAIHGRTKNERPQNPNRDHVIKAIAEAVKVPIIAK